MKSYIVFNDLELTEVENGIKNLLYAKESWEYFEENESAVVDIINGKPEAEYNLESFFMRRKIPKEKALRIIKDNINTLIIYFGLIYDNRYTVSLVRLSDSIEEELSK